MSFRLRIELLSDACFSGGVGFAGEVDIDVEQEETLGLPYIRGRTLKGLLVEECACILEGLRSLGDVDRWYEAANNLFGAPGESVQVSSLKIGNAVLPAPVREAVRQDIENNITTAHDILHSLTDIRHQTKIHRETKAPEPHSLRSTRLVLRGLVFHSTLGGCNLLGSTEKALLAAGSLFLRRGGLNRNRGWGKLKVRIVDTQFRDVTTQWVNPLFETWKGKNING